jgi:hypothetical protein
MKKVICKADPHPYRHLWYGVILTVVFGLYCYHSKYSHWHLFLGAILVMFNLESIYISMMKEGCKSKFDVLKAKKIAAGTGICLSFIIWMLALGIAWIVNFASIRFSDFLYWLTIFVLAVASLCILVLIVYGWYVWNKSMAVKRFGKKNVK